jgi:signal transduction histidine kinase
LQRPLSDWQGHPLRTLVMEAQETEIAEARQAADRETGLFLLFGIFLIAATAVAVHQWVVRPLARISASLAGDDPAPLAPLENDRSEFGRVARLALEAFAQRRALRTEIEQRTQAQAALEQSEAALRQNLEERARLGRDLHDGVIQSLYAAGMGLAGIRTQLSVEQAEAAARLEQTRAVLNDTIHDVRNFIHGLEPEALRQQTFAQAIAALLELMRSHRDFRSRIDIADDLARRLSLAQRVHALQIAREAVSNALRHSAASEIAITLGQTGNLIEFAVSDNGAGFNPLAGGASGVGLENFAQRARELGAELSVHSTPGAGTCVKLCLPLEHL